MIAEMDTITIAEEDRELPGEAVASPFQRRLRACLNALVPQRCHCDLHDGLTADDLRAMGGGCSSPRWVCPALDLVRRQLGV